MKIFALLGLSFLVLLGAGFAFVGMTDAPVTQTTITRDIATSPTSPQAPAPAAMTTTPAPVAAPAPAAVTPPASAEQTPQVVPAPAPVPTTTDTATPPAPLNEAPTE